MLLFHHLHFSFVVMQQSDHVPCSARPSATRFIVLTWDAAGEPGPEDT